MRIVLQRAVSGSVSVLGGNVAAIGRGYVILVGVGRGDSEEDAVKMAGKVAKLRIFEDGEGKMNLDIKSVDGDILSVPQFTLMANTKKGNRPGFDDALEPKEAVKIWERFNAELKKEDICVRTGVFGAHMVVNISNDGPVTFILESRCPQGGSE